MLHGSIDCLNDVLHRAAQSATLHLGFLKKRGEQKCKLPDLSGWSVAGFSLTYKSYNPFWGCNAPFTHSGSLNQRPGFQGKTRGRLCQMSPPS